METEVSAVDIETILRGEPSNASTSLDEQRKTELLRDEVKELEGDVEQMRMQQACLSAVNTAGALYPDVAVTFLLARLDHLQKKSIAKGEIFGQTRLRYELNRMKEEYPHLFKAEDGGAFVNRVVREGANAGKGELNAFEFLGLKERAKGKN
jgi:hypothetical protein